MRITQTVKTVVTLSVLLGWCCLWILISWTGDKATATFSSAYNHSFQQKIFGSTNMNFKLAPLLELGPQAMKNSSSGVNVLLLAYQRSGSSFLGEMLTSDENVTYIFEPLIEFFCIRNVRDKSSVLSVMKKMFNCDEWTLHNLNANRTATIPLLRKSGDRSLTSPFVSQGCKESKLRLIKTIRLRMRWAKTLLRLNKLNIVHLVRDPRAILYSMAPSSTWKESAKTPETQCGDMRKDLLIGSTLPKDRYTLVRYEDVVRNPLEVSVGLFQKLNLPLPKSLAFYIATHTQTERFFKYSHRNPHYFSTYRKSDHNINSWRQNMNSEKIAEIEKHCADVIEALGYPKFSP